MMGTMTEETLEMDFRPPTTITSVASPTMTPTIHMGAPQML